MEAQKRIEKLVEELNHHNHLYYIENKPAISDFDFDLLLVELQKLEEEFPEFSSENSPTKKVGGDITKKFDTVVHRYPMLSLSNSYSKEEIMEWENRIKKLGYEQIEYVCELKYDGVAIGISYQNGQFVRAVTRGDGVQGEDITNNVKTIKTVPLLLKGDYPDDFEIRGEIFFPLNAFHKLNEERKESGEAEFANPRNSASGTLKLQDSRIVASRGLDCFLYGIYGENLPFQTHYDSVIKAKEWGLKIPFPEKKYIYKTKSIDGIMDFIQYWDIERNSLPFEIDGVVLKVNQYSIQNELGFTAKSPRWAIAYKFKTERVETIIEWVSYQVGRTGAITPVANLTPVSLGGTVVKRASLHNSDQMEKLDLYEGDSVYVEKGGEIIPKIVGVNLNKRKSNTEKIEFISVCPECNTTLTRNDGEAQHYCPNEKNCPPQIKGKIEHFISRKAMNIDGLGNETVDTLVSKGLIKNVADLYELHFDDLLKIERMAEKSANNLLKGVEESKKVSFERVLFALGIRFVGETVAKKLAKEFKSIEDIAFASEEELISVDEIGEKIAFSVRHYFAQEENRILIERLKNHGLQLSVSKEIEVDTNGNLKGKIFVVSGVFKQFSRDEIKALIEKNGGKNASSISSKTNFVLAGENMGPAKLQKANELGIPIISEEDFLKMI
ncbi:MAG: NAD-dependent DNA ligase LigA [Flavobacteriia bacterium]|nr:NAD-dependent DNA ligase LigA [Flavobacteriia bacterium]